MRHCVTCVCDRSYRYATSDGERERNRSKLTGNYTQGINLAVIALFVSSYTNAALSTWLQYEIKNSGSKLPTPNIEINSSFLYNQTLRSLNNVIPGSIAIVTTVIGTLLTALVVAKEWERGTMEALMATQVSVRQILLGKLIPYFILGLISMILCWVIAVFYYNVPFKGSFFALTLVTIVFLLSSLGLGLFISSATKDQFMASQLALMSGFLPAMMLSGFVFEISSMPLPIRALTYIFSGRYIVTALRTLFLSGDVWMLLLKSILAMLVIALIFFFLASRKTAKRLDL